jgi:2-hydroxy-6-oxonona-2,4-dienedioate hydrolase
MAVLRWIAIALLALAAVTVTTYVIQIGQAYDRIAGRSKVVTVSSGDIEYLESGSGPAVLLVHGSGGGFDQGELVARAVLGDGFRWVAPSRFGYLRSTLPSGATFEDQADAYVRLLDHLGIKRVAVVALSQGGPSALFFALKYPERVNSLILISCGVSSSTDLKQAQANRAGDTLKTIFKYDFVYWSVSTVFMRQLMGLLGANDEVVAKLNADQSKIVDEVIDFMNPAKPRSAGVALDNRAAMPNEKIAAIRAPTLIFHAVDDNLQLFRNAEFAAATIPGARLSRFERGGHLLMAVEQETVRVETQKFILMNAGR